MTDAYFVGIHPSLFYNLHIKAISEKTMPRIILQRSKFPILIFLLLKQLKLIAYAPYSLECPLIGLAFKLFTESLYMNVNCS